MADDEVKRFTDVWKRGRAYPAAKQLRIDDVLDYDIDVLEYTLRESKYQDRGQMAIVKAYSAELNPDEPHEISFSTGSSVLLQQLEQVRGQLPVRTRIVKHEGRYYRMT